MTTKERTLADFDVPITLQCFHCDVRFPKTAQVDVQLPYVVVLCPSCGCLTPFKVEQ